MELNNLTYEEVLDIFKQNKDNINFLKSIRFVIGQKTLNYYGVDNTDKDYAYGFNYEDFQNNSNDELQDTYFSPVLFRGKTL